MKKLILSFFAAIPMILGAQNLPSWQPGYLDIHNIATGCGDCTFIKMPDGTTMLIDAGDMSHTSWNTHGLPDESRTPAQWIAHYISKVSPETKELDYVFLTHLHPDHMGSGAALRDGAHGYRVCGVLEVGEYFKVGTLVDRGWPDYDIPSRAFCEKQNPAVFPHYLEFIDRVIAEGGSAQRFKVASRRQFVLRHDPSPYKGQFEIFNVAGNALKATPGGKAVKMYSKEDNIANFDENMFSCAIRLRYGNFVYYNGGDLPGSNYGPKKRAPHNRDYESQIAGLIGRADVIKADHHGWKDTCNPNFMWTVRPDVVIIQASQARHPWFETLRRLTDPQLPGERQIYVTSDSGRKELGDELFSKMHAPGHIVVRVYPGGTGWKVFVLDACNEDNKIIEESPLKNL